MEFQNLLMKAMQEEEMNGPRRNVERNVQDVKTAIDIQKNMAKLSEFQRMNRQLGEYSNPLARVFK